MNYTLCLLRYKDSFLLLNREKKPWMGRWNGIGGKFEIGENGIECVKREIKEETNLNVSNVKFFGILNWTINDELDEGTVFLYVADITEMLYETPFKTREGILELKSIDWILNRYNLGIVSNLRVFLSNVLSNEKPKRFICDYITSDDPLLDYERVKSERVLDLSDEEIFYFENFVRE